MIIRCIETVYHHFTFEPLLVKDKDYKVVRIDIIGNFLVISENGKHNWFSRHRFETFDVMRDRKLNLLLYDMDTIC